MTITLPSALRRGLLVLAASLMPLTPSAATGVAPGSYLAALSARQAEDFTMAARYFQAALEADPENPVLLEESLRALIALGEFDTAAPLAERLEATGTRSQLSSLVQLAMLMQAGKWEDILAGHKAGRLKVAPPVDSLVQAWVLAANRDFPAAQRILEDMARSRDTAFFGLYHRALMLAVQGDYAGAEAVFAGSGTAALPLTRRGLIARTEILSQLGQHDTALALLKEHFDAGAEPDIAALQLRLEAGEALPLTIVPDAKGGLAEVFYTVSLALGNEAPAAYALAFSRMAETLRPDHHDALMLSSSLLDSLKQYDLAIETLARIPVSSPAGFTAQLGRAQSLMAAERYDEAIDALSDITRTYPQLPAGFRVLADAYRDQDLWEEAVAAYDTAIELYGRADQAHWGVFYMRAIARERSGDWKGAEADLRHALTLRPDQPQVLNNLGYSLLERKEKLDEALSMIERAVAAEPEAGYIVDSLGWAYFRLGRYGEAVTTMERAAALMATDPEVNDHLGDVYWAVGRKREAEFQWRRALSFRDDRAVVDFDRIRRKLELGLDAVLAAEGAPPLAPWPVN